MAKLGCKYTPKATVAPGRRYPPPRGMTKHKHVAQSPLTEREINV